MTVQFASKTNYFNQLPHWTIRQHRFTEFCLPLIVIPILQTETIMAKREWFVQGYLVIAEMRFEPRTSSFKKVKSLCNMLYSKGGQPGAL